jgi:hypothetical protein
MPNRSKINATQAGTRLLALEHNTREDPERAPAEAGEILLDACPPTVADAYRRLEKRTAWWAAG